MLPGFISALYPYSDARAEWFIHSLHLEHFLMKDTQPLMNTFNIIYQTWHASLPHQHAGRTPDMLLSLESRLNSGGCHHLRATQPQSHCTA